MRPLSFRRPPLLDSKNEIPPMSACIGNFKDISARKGREEKVTENERERER